MLVIMNLKLLLILAACIAVSSAFFTTNCMKCICEAAGCDDVVGRCSSSACGPYQITEPYYIDCKSPGRDWQSCTKYKSCSEYCVRNYMERYGTYCTRGRTPKCQDYAMIHYGGPTGCRKDLWAYWSKVARCCIKHGGCDLIYI